MWSLRPAILLVAAVLLRWSAVDAQADNGSTTCLCTGPQCVPPCPTTTPQFAFCPPRPPASIVPFPWQTSSPKPEFLPQEPGFLAAAAAWRGRTVVASKPVLIVCSAFLVLTLSSGSLMY